MKKALVTLTTVYIGYFLMEIVFTLLEIGDINWIEMNLFGVSGLFLSLNYINNIKRQSNEPIS